MKMDVDVNELTVSGIGEVHDFKMRATAHSFRILSSSLYTNKIRAVIRELSTNAYDSHVSAGYPEKPFDVHLPTLLEPWFSVRDYGVGLNHTQVTTIYSTYFESTKTHDDTQVGGLGLGSKSPFSYTENFTVTSIKDGIKGIYTAFIDDVSGCPRVAEMLREKTTEDNGVEVKFSVPVIADFDKFKQEACVVFQWFGVMPDGVTVDPVEYEQRDIVPGVHRHKLGYRHNSYALMGNIPYPLDNNRTDLKQYLGTLAEYLKHKLVIEFDIGAVKFAASREELSYEKTTLAAIKAKLTELHDGLDAFVVAELANMTTTWDKLIRLSDLGMTELFSTICERHRTALHTMFERGYYGRALKVPVSTIVNMGVELSCYEGRGSCNTRTLTPSYGSDSKWTIPVSKGTKIVFDDGSTGGLARIKYHFGTDNKNTVVFVQYPNTDTTGRQAAFDEFKTLLGDPTNVYFLSALTKRPTAPRAKTVKVGGLLEYTKDRGNPYNYSWGTYRPVQGTHYYVELSNNDVVAGAGSFTGALGVLRRLLDTTDIPEFKDLVIYGVRQQRIADIKKSADWVPLDTYIASVLSSHLNDSPAYFTYKALVASGRFNLLSNEVEKEVTHPKSLYKKIFAKYRAACLHGIYVCTPQQMEHRIELSGHFAPSLLVGQTVSVAADIEALVTTYPVLDGLSGTPSKLIARYINLEDGVLNQRKRAKINA